MSSSNKPDLESGSSPFNSSFVSTLSTQIGTFKDNIFSKAPSDQQYQQQQQQTSGSPLPINFIVSKMNDRSDYTKAFISFAVCALFLLFSIFSLPTIIISPQKFTLLFTISVIALIFGLAFMNGPASYVKKLTEKKNLMASCVLFGSMIFSLYFSIIQGSYLLSILFCFIELNAVLLFFCNTFPAGSAGVRLFGSTARSVISSSFAGR